ncbi:MAG: hypothetical protein N2441_05275 [Rhodocyclaceae bacterium]|nr:hypothetical protein [Rhodocyclaceae bacterium]
MNATTPTSDPMEYLKELWGQMGFALPGMVVPTLDTDELGKRIADLKAVEGWLKSNLSLLSMTIQALETQRTTLLSLKQLGETAAGQAAGAGNTAPNPFLNPAFWAMPWALTPGGSPAAAEAQEAKKASGKRRRSATSEKQREPKG